MRCPNCRFVCSDLRDSCPYCGIPFKTESGTERLNKISSGAFTAPRENEETARSEERSFLHFLKRITSESTHEQQTRSEKGQEQRNSTSEKDIEPDPSPLIRRSATQIIETDVTFHERQLDLEDDSTVHDDFEDESETPETADFTIGSLLGDDQSKNLPESAPLPELEETVQELIQSRRAEDSLNQNSPHDLLFADAAVSLRQEVSTQGLSSLEFTPSERRTIISDEATKILFDLASQTFSDPESLSTFSEEIWISDTRTIKATAALKQLAAVETKIEVPRATIANKARKSETAAPQQLKIETERLALPRRGQRAAAAMLDGIASALIAFLGTGWLLQEMGVSLLYKSLEELFIHLLLPYGGLVLSVFLLSFSLFPSITILISDTTIGGLFTGMLARNEEGKRLKLDHLLVRTLSLPLATLFLGFIPVLFGNRSYHDRVARIRWYAVET